MYISSAFNTEVLNFMAISVTWADEGKTVCILNRGANWTWEEFDTANTQSNLMIKEINHSVDLIVAGEDRLPPGSPISHFRKAMKSKPANLRIWLSLYRIPLAEPYLILCQN